jgi:hypothetical protein
MANDTDTHEKKRTVTPLTTLDSFPVGDVTALVRLKGDRKPTADDLRHAAAACTELAAKFTALANPGI